jgi:hypothetical protein
MNFFDTNVKNGLKLQVRDEHDWIKWGAASFNLLRFIIFQVSFSNFYKKDPISTTSGSTSKKSSSESKVRSFFSITLIISAYAPICKKYH